MIKEHYTGGGANRTVEEATLLKKKYELFDTTVITDVFDTVMKLEVTGFDIPVNVGLPHVTYIVHLKAHRDMVLRANLGFSGPESQLVKEKLISELVTRYGIPANVIVHVDVSRRIFPFDFQIQEKFEGKDAEIEFQGTRDDYDTFSTNIGIVVARLSEINLKKFGHIGEKLVGESKTFYDYFFLEVPEQIEIIQRAGFVSRQTATYLLKVFEQSKALINSSGNSVVHYDLADHNIRYDPKSFNIVALYDWEASVIGDSVLDIASCPTWKTLYPRQEKLIQGYLSIKPKPDNFEDKLNIYRLRTILWKVVHNVKFGLVTPERMKRLADALVPYRLEMSA